ncbi:hypothetical protein ACI7YT_12585 [Microbacterium sp. M]|uniref:hypothetical protein n=1 Tax=Microbacterium sp. M TaxID=3377125 RepID=UPI0038641308
MVATIDATYRRPLILEGYCPGFNLWHVTATDGAVYLIDSDGQRDDLRPLRPLATAIYLRSNGKLDAVSAVYIGPNPDADAWKRNRGL